MNRNQTLVALTLSLGLLAPVAASAQTSCSTATAWFAASTPAPGFVPSPIALSCIRCSNGGGTTPTDTGSGSSCTSAQSSLTTQLKGAASAGCASGGYLPPCSETLITTLACTLTSPGVYQTSGYYIYKCNDNFC
jgi:hypothetical protein